MITIHSLEMSKKVFSEKQDWLAVNDKLDPIDYILWDEWRAEILYFSTYEELSNHIESLTEGFIQYWVDVHVDDTETIEYHNGDEWDIEYHFTTGRIELPEKVVKYVVDEYSKI